MHWPLVSTMSTSSTNSWVLLDYERIEYKDFVAHPQSSPQSLTLTMIALTNLLNGSCNAHKSWMEHFGP
jgi:hypothetical protein